MNIEVKKYRLKFKFEAGTSNYIGAIGLAKSLEYLETLGIDEITQYEEKLTGYTMEKLAGISGPGIGPSGPML